MTGRVPRNRGDGTGRPEQARSRALAAALALATALVVWPHSPTESVLAREPDPVTKTTKKTKAKSRGQGSAVRRPAPEAPPPTPAAVAIEAATAQLGKPYRWAGTGPNGFDCSGLVQFAYRQAGIELPHNSWAQLRGTERVPLDQLRPGDLVFTRGHVGIYIGDGKMVHSPETGRRVEVAPLRRNLIGAGRPVA